jgi:hypothetical protein
LPKRSPSPNRVESRLNVTTKTYSRQDDLDAQINTIGGHRSSRPGRARDSACGRNVLCNHIVNLHVALTQTTSRGRQIAMPCALLATEHACLTTFWCALDCKRHGHKTSTSGCMSASETFSIYVLIDTRFFFTTVHCSPHRHTRMKRCSLGRQGCNGYLKVDTSRVKSQN